MRVPVRLALALGLAVGSLSGVAATAPAASGSTTAAITRPSALASGVAARQLSLRPAATFTTPRPEQIISGPSFPGVAAWGVAYNSFTGEIIVGDYLSPQVRRYSRAGVYLGDFYNPTGNVGGVTSAIAVDPTDGYVYVVITGEHRTTKAVRKYTPQGVFMYDFDIAGAATWITVDNAGYLWEPSAFMGARLSVYRVDDFAKTAYQVGSISNPGTGPGQFGTLTGVATDAQRNVYLADSRNRVVHSYTASGQFRFDIGGPTIFPGDMRGVAVDDANSKLYVANSAKGTIEVFSLSGAHLATFGSAGTGPGQFTDGARQIALTPDGHLLAADYGAFRVLEFDTSGNYVTSFPNPALPEDPAGLSNARGIALDTATGDVLVADGWAQRIERFSANGTLLAQHGERGSTPKDGMNYPKSVAVDPATRNVWVGNYEGSPNLVVYSSDFSQVVNRIVTPRFVNDLEIVGNSVYAVIRTPGAVNVYDRTTGVFQRTIATSVGQLRGIGVDPSSGNIWLTSDTGPQVYIMSPDGNTRLATVQVDVQGWGIAFYGGIAYVSDAGGGEVVAFDAATGIRLGSFGSAGFGFGQLQGPSGLTTDSSGNIFIVEQRSGRVQEFGPSPRPAAEFVPPVVAFSATQPTGPQVVVTGTATDSSGVATVEIQVKNNTTGATYNARADAWTTAASWSPAIRWGPLTSSSWRFTTSLTYPATTYTVKVRSTDVLGNVSVPITRTFVSP